MKKKSNEISHDNNDKNNMIANNKVIKEKNK